MATLFKRTFEMDPAEAARVRREQVRLANAMAERQAREVAEAAEQLKITVAVEAEMNKEAALRRKKVLQGLHERVETAEFDRDCILPKMMILLVLDNCKVDELVVLSGVSLWFRKVVDPYFEGCFARDLKGIFVIGRAATWRQRYFAGLKAQPNVVNDFSAALKLVGPDKQLILLTPGVWPVLGPSERWSCCIRIGVTVEGVGFNHNYAHMMNKSRSALSADAVILPQLPSVVLKSLAPMSHQAGGVFVKMNWAEEDDASSVVSFRNIALEIQAERSTHERMFTCLNISGHVRLDNVFVESWQHSAVSTSPKGHSLLEANNCVFVSHGAHGIQIQGGAQVHISNSLIINSDNTGIEVLRGRIHLDGCIIAGNNYCGVSMVQDPDDDTLAPSSLKLTNCSIFDNGLYGVEVAPDILVDPEGSNNRIWRNAIGVVASQKSLDFGHLWDNDEEDLRIVERTQGYQEMAEESVLAGVCPVRAIGAHYCNMMKYSCFDCDLVGFKLICEPCAQHHIADGHRVEPREFGGGFCDCYLDSKTKCPFRPERSNRELVRSQGK